MAACTRTGVSKSKSWDLAVDGGFKKDTVHAEGPPGPGWIPLQSWVPKSHLHCGMRTIFTLQGL